MFLRFIVHTLDQESGKRQGLFQALTELEADGLLNGLEQQRFDEVYQWFLKNLKEPTTFSKSSKFHAKNVALGWFKDTAHQHIAKMREVAAILEDHGVSVEVIRSKRPGYIVYEDTFQVAAEPFRETTT